MTIRTFDWRPNPDVRSLAWRFSVQAVCSNLNARANIMRGKTVWLDQGQEGACTGFGEEHVRALSPYPMPASDETARAVYEEARRQDEWPGEDYEGSSVNGAMRASRQMGYIRNWYWCYNIAELKHALSYHGAVEAGTNWLSGMWDPDDKGILHVSGDIIGGHAYALAGYKVVDGLTYFRMENSWGRTWGDNGGAWISEFDMQALLAMNGELACPTKVRF